MAWPEDHDCLWNAEDARDEIRAQEAIRQRAIEERKADEQWLERNGGIDAVDHWLDHHG